jgi:hypothetical protein
MAHEIEYDRVPRRGSDGIGVPTHTFTAEEGPGVLRRHRDRRFDFLGIDHALEPPRIAELAGKTLVRAEIGVLQVDELESGIGP